VDIVDWARGHRDWIRENTRRFGGLLFRGFRLGPASELEALIGAVSGEVLSYENRSTPRRRVSGNIYTSTEFPADQSIPLHNEMSYTRPWPMKIWFHCVQPADWGGETPIADSRRVLSRIPAEIVEAFRRKGVLYVRNYGAGLDLSWQDVFQTTDRRHVEEFCQTAGIEYEWRGSDSLRTRERGQGTAVHPETGEQVWFNQAHLFHFSSLGPEVSSALQSSFEEAGLPRNSYYGDGCPIEPSSLEAIRAAYDREAIVFPWVAGDLLMLDNMLTAHARRPYLGVRQIVVGMAEAHRPPGS
jgi:alpha-ketoglutarate-dependent taurine dioxygenase